VIHVCAMKKAGVLSILCAVILLAVAVISEAQQPAKATRIGYLDDSMTAGSAELLEAFRKQMTQLGWVEGKNLTIEYRFGEGKGPDRLAELAPELISLKVDLIVVSGTSAALAAKKATSTIPIVMATVSDPVAQGIITSLARPGGNITGFVGQGPGLAGKRIEILKEVVPGPTRVGLLTGLGPGAQMQVKEMRAAALPLGLRLVEIGLASDSETLVNAFQMAVRERVNALITTSGPLFSDKEKALSCLPRITGCLPCTRKRNLSRMAVSCPTEWTVAIITGARRFT
jgi:putative ABC transport system substrate-binding protein